MNKTLNKKEIEKFSRQIILKNIGLLGQKKIKQAKVLIVGAGGLGCPAAEFLVRAGIGNIGIVDNDIVDISNIHRQSLFDINDVKIKMTLTNPNCPVAGSMPESVGKSVEKLSNLNSIEVSLVWDPKWHKDLMSEEAKLALDIF